MSSAWYKGLIAAGIVWLGLLWCVPAARQSLVFYESGAAAFCDYQMPQMCVASAKVYEPEKLSRVDAPYPAFGYAVAKAFPSDILKGAQDQPRRLRLAADQCRVLAGCGAGVLAAT